MLTIARTLSVLSAVFTLVFTVVVIGAGRLQLLRLGFEGTGIAAGLSSTLAAVAALLALVIVIVRVRWGMRAGFAQVALISGISLLVLGVVMVIG
ncbi:hypothetical protein [Bradyrhizobium sp.]|uniref:hypothetical protein n=1 Tax=Bradyrhizobium sp. TaxID=376 RepID=UPI003C77D0C8